LPHDFSTTINRLRAARTAPPSVCDRDPQHPQRGQAIAETAIILPVLLLLVMAVIDIGHMTAMHAAAVTASREAARYGAAVGELTAGTPNSIECAGIRSAARGVTGGLITLPDAQIVVGYDRGPGTTSLGSCPLGLASIQRFDRVVVTVTLTYRPVTPFVSSIIPAITVTSVDRRTIVKA
jgi:Flp pilus assembly protein TadG